MRRTVILLAALAMLLLAGAADLAWLYPRLPDEVATRFDASGAAVALAPKSSLLVSHTVLLAVLGLVFPGLAWLTRVLPAGCINVPHRDYWLAPGRIALTRVRMGELLLWLGNLNLAFLVVQLHLVMRANLQPRPALHAGTWIALAVYLAATLVTVLWFLVAFRRRPG